MSSDHRGTEPDSFEQILRPVDAALHFETTGAQLVLSEYESGSYSDKTSRVPVHNLKKQVEFP